MREDARLCMVEGRSYPFTAYIMDGALERDFLARTDTPVREMPIADEGYRERCAGGAATASTMLAESGRRNHTRFK